MVRRPVSAQRLSAQPVFSLQAFSPQPVWPQASQRVWQQQFSLLAWPLVSLQL
jgi:hypothetical protein